MEGSGASTKRRVQRTVVPNVSPDDFFANVMTPSKSAAINFTSDPQIRDDRLTNRSILTMIDVPSTSETSIGDIPNRILIAVSDAASNGTVNGDTVWTLYYVQQDTVDGANTGELLDYDSLGVDNNALYVGGNMFTTSGTFVNTSLFVIRKSSILKSCLIVVTAFRGLISGGEGPDSPRGVDNFDPSSTEGYVIGPSDMAFGRLVLRRVSNPGTTPSISGHPPITVNSTAYPISVNHLGKNTGGTNGQLDAIDDRLFAAHIRNGRLWTAHTIAVSGSGVSSSVDPQRRDAVRWYERSLRSGRHTYCCTIGYGF